jgi:hypothetical protein
MIRSIICVVLGALVAAGGVFWFTRDTHDEHWWALECEREDLQGKLELARIRLDARTGPDDPRLVNAREAAGKGASRLSGLREKVVELKSMIARSEEAFAQLQENRVSETRRLALGKEWTEFSSRDGRRYEQVKVAAIDDGGVTLRHLHGATKLRYADLTEEQRLLFALDREASDLAEVAEKKQAEAYHSWVRREEEGAELRERTALAIAFLSKPVAERRRTLPQQKSAAPEVRSSPLKIGSLDEPPRKLATSGRIFSRPRNNRYFYTYPNGGGGNSSGYATGAKSSPGVGSPPVKPTPPCPVNPVTQ